MGCFLPFLIIFNLFFGWLFLKPLDWLAIEAGLAILFMINSLIFINKIRSQATKAKPAVRRKGRVIDTEAEVIKDQTP